MIGDGCVKNTQPVVHLPMGSGAGNPFFVFVANAMILDQQNKVQELTRSLATSGWWF